MKKITLIIIILFFGKSIDAQNETCKVLLEDISGKYTGECIDGLADGKGKSIGEDTYIGDFKNGLPHGKGKYVYKNGDTFKGSWKMGKKNGKGKFKYTLNNEKQTLIGYWENDEYVGTKNPEITYKVINSLGIIDYKIEKLESTDNKLRFSIKSAFTDFAPKDLKVEISSGQVSHVGKKFEVHQYFCPLYCEINYTILIAETKKQCRFIMEVLEEGNYKVTLFND